MSDFSRPPQKVLAENVEKGYVGLYFEQGVPILDRDLNLLQDLITATVRSIVARYIGNGVPLGSQGFEVKAIPAENDFRILAGAPPPGVCLVEGIEVSIAKDKNYSEQLGANKLTTPTDAQPNPRNDIVYLDVFLETVDGVPALQNLGDIGIQTSVRLRPAWIVQVVENATESPAPEQGHAHFLLARLARTTNNAKIEDAMITDLRRRFPTIGDINRLLVAPAFNPPGGRGPFDPPRAGVGGEVKLLGRNFNVGDEARVQVLFGQVAAEVKNVAATEVLTVVPSGATGRVNIKIITEGGSAVSDDLFRVD